MMGQVVYQLDVKAAFLNSILKDPVYVEQPVHHVQGDRRFKVLKLRKALYRLVEAPKLWYDTLRTELIKMGFKTMVGDSCMFVLKQMEKGKKHILIMGVFVDDFLLFSTSERIRGRVMKLLGDRFQIKRSWSR